MRQIFGVALILLGIATQALAAPLPLTLARNDKFYRGRF
jgi:hypothetical protein